MRGIFMALSGSFVFWGLMGLAYSVSQSSEFGARLMALIILPCAVVAVLIARKPSGR